MKIQYELNGEPVELAIDAAADDRFAAEVTAGEGDPATFEAACRSLGGEAFLLSVGDQQYLTHAVLGPEGWHVQIGGETHLIVPPEILEARSRRGAGQVDLQNHVTPPMPGQVIKILVEEGEDVEEGQAIIVISAMKMETTLSAPHAGKVTSINTKVEAQVSPGDILVDIEE